MKTKPLDISTLPPELGAVVKYVGGNPKQLAFALATHEKVSGLCPRRAGKTVGAVAKICLWAVRRPNARMVYIALTRGHAIDIAWSELKQFNNRFGLGIKFLESKFIATWPNGSTLGMLGGDRADQLDKLRGMPWDLVVIDEGKSYGPVKLRELIEEVIDPGLGDFGGTIAMIGTPGRVRSGPFFEGTTTAKNWDRHHWSLKDNTAMPHLWKRALAKRKELGKTSPKFIREYLGQWAVDEAAYVFPNFKPAPWRDIEKGVRATVFVHCTPDSFGAVLVSEQKAQMVVHASERKYFWTLADVSSALNRLSENGRHFVRFAPERLEKDFVKKLTQYLNYGIGLLAPVRRDFALPFVASGVGRNDIVISDGILATEVAALQWEELPDDARPEDRSFRGFAEGMDYACVTGLLNAWENSTYRFYSERELAKDPWWYDDEEAFLRANLAEKTKRKDKTLAAWLRG